jgi:ATP:ADP antiporter, AAA family
MPGVDRPIPSPFPPERKSWLDRALSLVTDVRPGEGFTALLLAANIFTFLGLYSALKPVRSALILSESGAVAQSYAAAAQALLLLAVVPLYSSFASRVNRLRLTAFVTIFFSSNLVIFYGLGRAGVRIGIPFYIWIGIFNLMVPALLWALANDVYTNDRGKRLLPVVGIGASLGAWVGAEAASILFRSLGPYPLMLGAAAALFVCLGLSYWVHRREGSANKRPGDAHRDAEQKIGGAGGFQLVLKQRYLLYIGLLMIVLNLVNTLGEFVLGRMVELEAGRVVAASGGAVNAAQWIGGYMASFQANVNLLGLILQLFVVSRVIKYIGVRGALFVMPIVSLATYGTIAVVPLLGMVRIFKTFENSTDYSIQNTARQALFLPTSREAKYKAKQAIDSFFVRAGDMLQAVVVFASTALAFGVRGIAMLNLVFVGLWLILVVAIVREHKKLVPVESPSKVAA